MVVLPLEEVDVWLAYLECNTQRRISIYQHLVACHEIKHRVLADRYDLVVRLFQAVEVDEVVGHQLELVRLVDHRDEALGVECARLHPVEVTRALLHLRRLGKLGAGLLGLSLGRVRWLNARVKHGLVLFNVEAVEVDHVVCDHDQDAIVSVQNLLDAVLAQTLLLGNLGILRVDNN